MLRETLWSHPKFLRLCTLMGDSTSQSVGWLLCLWRPCYASGDPVVGDADAVESVADYRGRRGKLCKSLLQCGGDRPGFIEPVPGRDGIFQVHDLADHAPDYIRRRSEYELERRKEKACEQCGCVYHSRVKRSRFCTDNCRLIKFRNASGGKSEDEIDAAQQALETHGNDDVRFSETHETHGNATLAPAHAPSSSVSTQKKPSVSTRKGARSAKTAGGGRTTKTKTDGKTHQQAIDVFCRVWKDRYGEKYSFAGGKDGDAVKWMLSELSGDVAKFRAVVKRYFAVGDKYHARRRHTIGLLRQDFNQFKVAQPADPDDPYDFDPDAPAGMSEADARRVMFGSPTARGPDEDALSENGVPR